MNKAEKAQVVDSLRESFQAANVVVVAQYRGISAGDATELRRRMRAAGATFRVTKNRLAKLALRGTDYEALADLFTGPTAIAFSDDPVAAAKASADFSKKNRNLVVVGGALRETALNPNQVKELASLPSLDELRASLLGLLMAPAQKLAQVTAAPAAQVARVLAAHAEANAE